MYDTECHLFSVTFVQSNIQPFKVSPYGYKNQYKLFIENRVQLLGANQLIHFVISFDFVFESKETSEHKHKHQFFFLKIVKLIKRKNLFKRNAIRYIIIKWLHNPIY